MSGGCRKLQNEELPYLHTSPNALKALYYRDKIGGTWRRVYEGEMNTFYLENPSGKYVGVYERIISKTYLKERV